MPLPCVKNFRSQTTCPRRPPNGGLSQTKPCHGCRRPSLALVKIFRVGTTQCGLSRPGCAGSKSNASPSASKMNFGVYQSDDWPMENSCSAIALGLVDRAAEIGGGGVGFVLRFMGRPGEACAGGLKICRKALSRNARFVCRFEKKAREISDARWTHAPQHKVILNHRVS